MAENALQKIIRLNKDIKDPNKIMPGQKIKTDNGEVTVQKGDTLTKIANRPAPSKPQPSPVQDPQQKAAAAKSEPTPAPKPTPKQDDQTAKSGREALLNRSMGATHAKIVNSIARTSSKLNADNPTPAGSKEDRLPSDHTGSASAGDRLSPAERASYEKSVKPWRDVEAKSRKVDEAVSKEKDDAKVEKDVANKKETADKISTPGMEKPKKRVQTHDNPHGAIKLKNGTEIVMNPNRIGDQNSPTGYDPTTGTPNYSVGPAKGGIVAHYDQFFGDYIAENEGMMTFSEWAHKYKLPATRERKAIKDAQGKIHWRNVPKGAK